MKKLFLNIFIILNLLVCQTFFINQVFGIETQITEAQYYIDSNAPTTLSFTKSDGIATISEQINLNALSDGLHNIYVRFKDDSYGWGPARCTSFLVSSIPAEEYAITDAEYYIDSESPTSVSFLLSGGTATVTEEINLNALSEGLHTINVRYKDEIKGWGPVRSTTFLVSVNDEDQKYIASAEYFIDTDPGIGSAITIDSPTDGNYDENVEDFSFEPDIPEIGNHQLYLRTQDNTGKWSPTRSIPFVVTEEPLGIPYIIAAEYFIDSDDQGKGMNTAIPNPIDGAYDESEEEFAIDANISGLSEGDHFAFIRTKSSRGIWGPPRGSYFKVSSDAQPVIADAEYFFDADPGQGNGIQLSAISGNYNSFEEESEVEIDLSNSGLSEGSHKVYVRYKNSKGEWGAAKSKTFNIVTKPTIEIAVNTFDFGVVFISDSLSKEFWIKNSGDADLEISNITLPEGYSTDWNTTIGTIRPIDSLLVTITFKPIAEKNYNGNIVIENNDVNKTISVLGSGSSIPIAKMDFLPLSPYDFGEVDIFTEITKDLDIKLTNSGTAKLFINSVSISNSDIISHNFSIGDSIDIGSEVNFTITFSPQDTVQYDEYLLFDNNSSQNPFQYDIVGMGTGKFAPNIVTTKEEIDFGTVQTGNNLDKTLFITNTGTIDLNIESIISTNSDFTSNLSTSNNIVSPEDTNEITITFSPSSSGNYYDSLLVNSNDIRHSPKIVILKGIGSSVPVPDILVSKDSLNFGNIETDSPAVRRTISINNIGSLTLNISQITTTDNAFTIDKTSLSVSPGNSSELNIDFNPSENKLFEAELQLSNNDPDIHVYIVKLIGSSVFPEIFVSSTNINFGEVAVQSSKDESVTIENSGTDTLKISGFSLSEGLDTIFTVLPLEHDILPQTSKMFKITFTPVLPIEYSGSITVINNAQNEQISISGTGYDGTPPTIDYNPLAIENSGKQENIAIPISVSISDDNQVVWAKLFYTIGGKADFDSVSMDESNGVYSAEIPAAYVTERGVEYYLKAFDGANYKTIPEGAPEVPAVVQVKISSLPPLTFPSEEYQMFSIPSNLKQKNAKSLLEDILGKYDDEKWRLLRWVNGAYVELNKNPNFKFDPGKAFWLITKDQEVINLDTSVSVKTNENFRMSLDEGWNQVGTPFYFSLSWDDVYEESPGIIQGQVAYEWSGEGWVTATKLEKFKGYFIFTPSGGNVLKFPPAEATNGVGKTSEFAYYKEDEWNIQLSTVSGVFHDKENFAGVRYEAEENWDIYDRMDPPPFGDSYVNIYFDKTTQTIVPGNYAGDFKNITTDGHYFDFRLVGYRTKEDILLKIDSHNKIPSDFKLFLIDKKEWTGKELSDQNEFIFNNKTQFERNFRLIVGNSSFISKNNLGVKVTPTEFKLSQNYPNPFNPTTTIAFDLPSKQNVHLVIYNYLGQTVKTIVNENKKPGYYRYVWNGTDQKGKNVGSGIYFYMVKSEKYQKMKKMVLIK